MLGFVLKAFFFFCCWEATHSEDGSKTFENGRFAGRDEEEGNSWLRTFASAELGLVATLIRALDLRLTLSTYNISKKGMEEELESHVLKHYAISKFYTFRSMGKNGIVD